MFLDLVFIQQTHGRSLILSRRAYTLMTTQSTDLIVSCLTVCVSSTQCGAGPESRS